MSSNHLARSTGTANAKPPGARRTRAVTQGAPASKKSIVQPSRKGLVDLPSFLSTLTRQLGEAKVDKAIAMLKASGFQLYGDLADIYLSGVVKSQTDPDLVYACRIEFDGTYSCCTQNLNICGGLKGSICKHLLVLIIGLVQECKLQPKDIDYWIGKTWDTKPELNKQKMSEIFIKYKGAEAGEIDWRPTETLPEDYYAV